MLTYVTGDIVALSKTGHYDAVAHGCNCYCSMVSQVGKKLSKAYPAVKTVDEETQYGDFSKLGTFTYATDPKNLIYIFNLYTQFRYGFNGRRDKLFNYQAFEDSIIKVKEFMLNEHQEYANILMPMVGSDFGAGGDWAKTAPIVEKHWDCFNVTVCRF